MENICLNDFSGQWIGNSTKEIVKDGFMHSKSSPSQIGCISVEETYIHLNKSADGVNYDGFIFCQGRYPIELQFTGGEGRQTTKIDGKLKLVFPLEKSDTFNTDILGSVKSASIVTFDWQTPYAKYKTTLFGSHKADSTSVASEEVTWDEFKKSISRLAPNNFIFRGQRNANWRMRNSYFRSGGKNLNLYLEEAIPELKRCINSISNYVFSDSDIPALLNLAQHHGFPTPLIDWTKSPYIAAYFAFRGIDNQNLLGKSKIYVLDKRKWDVVKKIHKPASHLEKFQFLLNHLHIDFVDLPILNNNRALPQQALVGITNIDDIEADFSKKYGEEKILYAFEISHKERDYVLHDLNYMGINAATLFPGLDGLCEKLKDDHF